MRLLPYEYQVLGIHLVLSDAIRRGGLQGGHANVQGNFRAAGLHALGSAPSQPSTSSALGQSPSGPASPPFDGLPAPPPPPPPQPPSDTIPAPDPPSPPADPPAPPPTMPYPGSNIVGGQNPNSSNDSGDDDIDSGAGGAGTGLAGNNMSLDALNDAYNNASRDPAKKLGTQCSCSVCTVKTGSG